MAEIKTNEVPKSLKITRALDEGDPKDAIVARALKKASSIQDKIDILNAEKKTVFNEAKDATGYPIKEMREVLNERRKLDRPTYQAKVAAKETIHAICDQHEFDFKTLSEEEEVEKVTKKAPKLGKKSLIEAGTVAH